jgi:phosphoribosylformimino-5-aminoimidazole carboxamide ribotide isomerase
MDYIPAIDLYDGYCVRLYKGDFNKVTKYRSDPLAVAKEYEAAGFRKLHVVDLNGATGNNTKQQEIIQKLCTQTHLSIQLGGGIKNAESVSRAFSSGIDRVIIGSMAVQNPLWIKDLVEQYGTEKIILGLDLKGRTIAVSGWKNTVSTDYQTFLQQMQTFGITQVICTQIEKDGTLSGPDLELYREILSQFEFKLIASGGIAKVADLKAADAMGCSGAILGKALYEKSITLTEMKELIQSC